MAESDETRSARTLWQWPDRARFGRVVPKARFYEYGHVSARVREQFVSQVAQVTWAYKLASSTVGLAATETVTEIEVLEVALKPDVEDVAGDVLTAINRAIPAPLLVEVTRAFATATANPAETVRLAAAPTKDRAATFVSTPWMPTAADRTPLPPALDLSGLHAALLTPLLPYAVRPGESLTESAARATEVRRLEREVAVLERRIRNEGQFNRRAEINRTLRSRVAALAALASTPTAEEPQWRS